MAGLSLRYGDCGGVEEAQAHAEATNHANFVESTEAVLNLICSDCGKPCRSQTEVDLHTKRTSHTEFADKTAEAAKPIDLQATPAMTSRGGEEGRLQPCQTRGGRSPASPPRSSVRGSGSSSSASAGGIYGSFKDWLLGRWRPQHPTAACTSSSGSKSGSGTTLSNTYTSGDSSYDHHRLNLLVMEERAEAGLVRAIKLQADNKSSCRAARAHGSNVTYSLDRWLSSLDVEWVLGIADVDDDDASAAAAAGGPWHISAAAAITHRNHALYAGRWIQALSVITRTILRAYSDPFGGGLSDLYMVLEDEEEEPLVAQASSPDQLQLTRARFAQAAILKMLPFVDAVVASSRLASASGDDQLILASANDEDAPPSPPAENLQTLLNVRDALSDASSGIQLWLHSASSAEAKQESSEVFCLLAAKTKKLDEAVWNTMEDFRTRILAPTDDRASWGTQSPPKIARVTRSLINHIRLLWSNHKQVRGIVQTAADLGTYVPEHDRISCCFLPEQESSSADPFVCLTLEMVSCLEDKLAEISESFPDQGLRALFLLNNTSFIWQQLHPLLLGMECHTSSVLARRTEDYIQRYLQVSWAPVLSWLHDLTPLCFGRTNNSSRPKFKNSSLPKFESEFQKVYSAQKHWKVPDPELRKRLRKAIVERVVSGYTEYLENNNMSFSAPRVTPQELENMLQELFEG